MLLFYQSLLLRNYNCESNRGLKFECSSRIYIFVFLAQKEVIIGMMPVMLRSCCCQLYKKDDDELAKLGMFSDTLEIYSSKLWHLHLSVTILVQVSAHLIQEDTSLLREMRRFEIFANNDIINSPACTNPLRLPPWISRCSWCRNNLLKTE